MNQVLEFKPRRAPFVLALTMAGLYRRFREAGYGEPKWLLPYEGAPLLSRIIRELCRASEPERLVMIANGRDRAFGERLIAAAMAAALPRTALRWVEDTAGQAETARNAAAMLTDNEASLPFFVHNIDTLLVGRDLGQAAVRLGQDLQGWIDVFPSDSPAFSYVAHEPNHRVTAIVEKRVISTAATTGLYGFSSAGAYLGCYDQTTWSGGERYISDVYASMLERGILIGCDWGLNCALRRTVVLGTPAEYEAANRPVGQPLAGVTPPPSSQKTLLAPGREGSGGGQS